MRFLGLGGKPAEDPEPDKDQDTPQGTPPEEDQIPELPQDADLDSLYDRETGEPLYEIDGKPCDAEGNLIPPTKPGTPEPEKPQEKAPEKPVEYTSPFSGEDLTEEEKTYLSEHVDPNVLAILDRKYSRQVDRTLQARDQQRAIAQEIGIPETMLSKVAAMEPYVPHNIRGTKQGAITAALMAVGEEAAATGDLQGALKKLLIEQSVLPVKPSVPEVLLPPSARPTTPRGNPETRPVRRVPRDVASISFQKDGLEGDVISILQSERKPKAERR